MEYLSLSFLFPFLPFPIFFENRSQNGVWEGIERSFLLS